MAEAEQIENSLRDGGLEMQPLHLPDFRFPDLVYAGIASGPLIEPHHALVRANGEICRILAWLRHAQSPHAVDRTHLAEVLLSLNFGSTFGRISLGADLDQPGQPNAPLRVYVETVYFWQYAERAPDLFKVEIRRRLQGFSDLLNQAAQVVASLPPVAAHTPSA